MKKLLVTFLLTILSFITYSQSGVGYVNYTSYKTHNGNGVTNQYNAHPNKKQGFYDNLLLKLFVDYHNQALYLNTLTSPTMRIYHQHFLSNSIHLLFLKFLIYHFLKPEKCWLLNLKISNNIIKVYLIHFDLSVDFD